ncbi:MAG: ABC transporter substrate-binding protein, partial [Promethearchaeota archaeon]
MERTKVIAIVVVVLVVLGAGATFVFMTQPTKPAIDSYVYESSTDPESLDPHFAYESGSAQVFEQVYETLYTYPWGGGERGGHPEAAPTVPLLAAAAPDISADGMQYNITLRQGITFHDGTPFNASALKWSWERGVKMHYGGGPIFMLIEPLAGGEHLHGIGYEFGPSSAEFQAEFTNWTANSNALVVLDTYTLQINFGFAYAGFIPAVTNSAGAAVSPSFVHAHAANDTVPAGGDWTKHYGLNFGEDIGTYMFDHTCGTGPYMVEEWKPTEYVKMVLYEDYWRAGATEAAVAPPSYAGSIKEIWRRTNEDQTSMNLNLRTGVVDDTHWPATQADEIYDNVTLGSKDPNIFFRTGGVSSLVSGLSFQMGMMDWTIQGVGIVETYAPCHWRGFRNMMAYLFDHDA